jgi:molecular chaperone GrpE
MAKKESSASENPEIEQTMENEGAESSEGKNTTDTEAGTPDHAELTLMLEDARAKADEHWDQLLRANAELENARRRARQDVENAHKFALEKFALELLPVKDSLEMGLLASSEDSTEAAARLREGTELTLKMLASAMEKFGIVAIDPMGEAFNPETQQAMSMQESDEHAPNTVMMVMQKGYQLNDRLIRPAMVVVSKAASKDQGEESQESVDSTDEKA